MKLFLGFLLLAAMKTVLCSNNGGRDTSTSSFKSNLISNSTIIRHTTFNTTLNHLVVDRNTGKVFVAGMNSLFQLSPDLEIQEIARTGPENDYTSCMTLECSKPDTIHTLIDNYNKVLLIDYSASRLITCGSVFQGSCTVHNLQNASLVEQNILEAVAANNNEASTVAFIAPAPRSLMAINVMYVGVTNTGNSPYRNEIPAVSSRSLEKENMFQIASSVGKTGTRMFINSHARESYIVNYVYGFSSEKFSYFLTTQHKFNSTSKEYITKLVRICQDDTNYYSYTEIPVECANEAQGRANYNLVRAAYLSKPGADLAQNLGITPHDDVLYAVFSEWKENVQTNHSALCVYSLKAIRRKFTQNIQECFNGNVPRGLDFLLPKINCPTKFQTISEDFCGLGINLPFGGEQPITAVPVTIIPHQLTSVAATRTSGYTVVFIGTIEGHLKKVVVESATSAIENADIIIDEGSKVNADMHFDPQELHLYVMTKRTVAKVKVHNCTLFQTCKDCLGAKDPYCGWCLSESKCSLRSNCRGDINDPIFWISYKTDKCTTIINISPHQLERTTTRTSELQIDHLPALKVTLACAFVTAGGPTIYTNATRKMNGVLTFFDCSTHLSCTRCIASQFPCDWCVEAHRCTHDTAENCRNDTVVPSFSQSQRIGASNQSEPGFSPSINATGNGNENLVEAGANKSIEMNSQIEDFTPKFGPISGGTRVTIIGKDLNAGSRIEAFIDEQPCEILSANETQALCRTSPAESQSKGKLKMTFDNGEREFDGSTYEYVKDPTIDYVSCGPNGQWKSPKGIPAGGIKITVVGNQFEAIQQPNMYVYFIGKTYLGGCKVVSNEMMHCYSPSIDDPDSLDQLKNLTPYAPAYLQYGFKMNDVIEVRNKDNNRPFELYPNPVYLTFDENVKNYKSRYLTINGRNLDLACRESDVVVMIGNGVCNITSLLRHQLTCKPLIDAIDSNKGSNVSVTVGNVLTYNIGVLSYASPNKMHGYSWHIFGVIAGGFLLLLICVVLLVAYRKKTKGNRVLKQIRKEIDFIELQVTAECKEAFAALQIEISDLNGDQTGSIPFLDYQTYGMKILFPNNEYHCVLQLQRPELLHKEKGLRLFRQLIMNKTFLLLFIRTLESNCYFWMSERVNVASLIMVTLESELGYCTDILKALLAELIKKSVDRKMHPKLLLRRTESVAENMLRAWFTFLLYKFLKECAGKPLYMLFRAVKGQLDKGPVDAITHDARYSLSEEKLIPKFIEFKVMTVYASHAQRPIIGNNIEMLPRNTENISVKVLDCDAISQVKEKCLDTIYRNTPWSQRPRGDDLDLEWRLGTTCHVMLYDEDSTSKLKRQWKKLNTLHHYQVPDGAFLCLVSKQGFFKNLSTLSDESHQNDTLLNYAPFSRLFSHAIIPLNEESQENSCHLVNHHDIFFEKNKLSSEIRLTRLLATKGTLQKYVDDLFETIFSTVHCGSAFPLAIKYMFDFLDDQAVLHGITDPEVIHTWKSNGLPLRFWISLIKNPNFVFDIHKSDVVGSCMYVVAQAFMDSCSTLDYTLGKDSISSKLMYAKNISKYRRWVDRYYSNIRDMPAVSDQDMIVHMSKIQAEVSTMYPTESDTNWALHELYKYAVKYNEQLITALEEYESSQNQESLAYKLKQVHNIFSSD